jgi:hypothetical protein
VPEKKKSHFSVVAPAVAAAAGAAYFLGLR